MGTAWLLEPKSLKEADELLTFIEPDERRAELVAKHAAVWLLVRDEARRSKRVDDRFPNLTVRWDVER